MAGPFWAQAVNQKRQYLQIRIYKSLHFRPCRSCRKSQKVPTMLFCPARIPSNARGFVGLGSGNGRSRRMHTCRVAENWGPSWIFRRHQANRGVPGCGWTALGTGISRPLTSLLGGVVQLLLRSGKERGS